MGILSQINIDFANLIWEDFVYQVKHKNQKRSNEMNYPRFTKVIIDYCMTRKPFISRRNKINWHYVRDDALFSTIKVVSRHHKTQQYGAILPIELTTDEIRNSKAYKEYYAYAMGEAAPKPKASAKKKKGESASSTTPPTLTPTTTVESAPRLSAIAKGKQPSRAITPTERTDVQRTEAKQLKIILKRSRQETHISQQRGFGTDEGTGSKPGVLNVPSDDSKEELSWNSSDDEDVGGHEEGNKSDESDDDHDEGSDDDSDETVKAGAGKDDDDDDDEDDDDNNEEEELAKDDDEETETGKGGDEVKESEGESEEKETRQEGEESFDPIPRTPEESEEKSNDEKDQELRLSEEARIQEEEDADELYRDVNINQGRGLQVTQNVKDTHVTQTLVNPDGPQESSSVSSFVTIMLNPTNDTPIMTPPTIATITTSGEAPIPSTTIPSIILENLPMLNSAFRFDERLRSLETSFFEYRQTNPFVDAVSSILADLSEMELKKILIEKMEGNKSIQRSDEQRNLYKALVEGYDADKAILDTYGDSTILKRKREDDDQEGPSAGSDRGSKRQKEGGEHASASTPSEKATESASKPTKGSQSGQLSASESASTKEPVQTTCQMEEPPHPVFETGADDQPIIQTSQHPEWFSQPRKPPLPDRDWNKTLPAAQGDAQSWISVLARQTDARSSFNELLDTPLDFSNFIMNMINVDTLTPELLAGPTYELMRGSCTSLTELEYHLEEVYKATTDQLDWVNPEGQQYPHNQLQPLPLIPDNRGRRVITFDHFINNDLKYLRGDVYSKRRIIAVTELQIVEWHDYKHLDWISDVHQEHCHQKVSGRPSTRSGKLPEEAQPYEARHVPTRSEAT
nr:hypothetical protein [Tanacetum cinerariifolium]